MLHTVLVAILRGQQQGEGASELIGLRRIGSKLQQVLDAEVVPILGRHGQWVAPIGRVYLRGVRFGGHEQLEAPLMPILGCYE